MTKHASRSGLTLLEVLLTSVLLATLLMGIWSLYHTFSSLYETGYLATEKAQLFRSLVQQLSLDLKGTIVVPPSNDRPRQSSEARSGRGAPSLASRDQQPADGYGSTARRIGLRGTYQSLRLDVLQAQPPEAGDFQTEEAGSFDGKESMGKSTDLLTVTYTFQPPYSGEMDRELSNERPGLTRREIRINRRGAAQRSGSGGQRERGGSGQEISGTVHDSAREPSGGARSGQMLGEVTMHLPEVVAMEFRYFDGQSWTDAWDSRVRGSLPVAVEVALQIDSEAREAGGAREVSGQFADSQDTPGDGGDLFAAGGDLFSERQNDEPDTLPIRRVLIDLPQARPRGVDEPDR